MREERVRGAAVPVAAVRGVTHGAWAFTSSSSLYCHCSYPMAGHRKRLEIMWAVSFIACYRHWCLGVMIGRRHQPDAGCWSCFEERSFFSLSLGKAF